MVHQSESLWEARELTYGEFKGLALESTVRNSSFDPLRDCFSGKTSYHSWISRILGSPPDCSELYSLVYQGRVPPTQFIHKLCLCSSLWFNPSSPRKSSLSVL